MYPPGFLIYERRHPGPAFTERQTTRWSLSEEALRQIDQQVDRVRTALVEGDVLLAVVDEQAQRH